MLENSKIAKLRSDRNEMWSPTEWKVESARRRASPWGSRWTPWFCRRQPSGHRWLRATGTRFAAPGRCRCCNQFIHAFIYTCLSSSLLVIDEHAEFVSSLAVIATLLVEFPEQVLESLPSAAVDLMLQELFDVRGFALKMWKWIKIREKWGDLSEFEDAYFKKERRFEIFDFPEKWTSENRSFLPGEWDSPCFCRSSTWTRLRVPIHRCWPALEQPFCRESMPETWRVCKF